MSLLTRKFSSQHFLVLAELDSKLSENHSSWPACVSECMPDNTTQQKLSPRCRKNKKVYLLLFTKDYLQSYRQERFDLGALDVIMQIIPERVDEIDGVVTRAWTGVSWE